MHPPAERNREAKSHLTHFLINGRAARGERPCRSGQESDSDGYGPVRQL